jgi:amidase
MTQRLTLDQYYLFVVPLGFQPDTIEVLPAEPSPLHTQAPGLPFGLAFVGTAYTEFDLIGYAYAFEQATHARLKRKAYTEAIPKTQLKHMISRRRG